MRNFTLLITIILFVLTGMYYSVFSQQSDTLYIRMGENGKIRFARFAVNDSSNRKMAKDTIFLKSILGTTQDDEFRLKRENTDELGITHKRFQQYYKGIKVENANYLLHGKNGNIDVINGSFQIINIPTILPAITEQQALSAALDYVGSDIYKWEDERMENFIKRRRNDTTATYYPQGELVIAKDNLTGSNSFKLSWKFSISSLQPDNAQIIFVDANNGDVIRDKALIINSNVTGGCKKDEFL